MERKFVFVILIAALLLTSCGRDSAVINDSFVPEITSDQELLYEEKSVVIAQIDGAVNNPGVYEVCDGDRVLDLVNAAGGMCDDAAIESINLAEVVADGMRYHIMTVTEYEAGLSGASAKININTATIEQLMTLAGIGESKARSIVEYREKNGLFKSVEDLLKVSGIKRGTLDKILADITI